MSLHKSHSCGKVRFRDHREAVSALHNVTTLRKRAEEDMVPSRRREVRTYECDACHGHHLTSMAA
ncbi:hypothetical protein [Microbacterium thalassium]|uniref:Uncharacterized protein n=1 Tax=Microbacterium thalassium TaxID=362649 RepID=A0A7X0KTD9_9MICO|nr:hypothetical protein [Microbacterium thalassium]MBB6389987.1 hypothetical protein [Microbacterium thalassium]GLK24673.1 hypothetical protein GCM10017607_19910 [Microbacterium thalassium]